jgi:hypothetical protein
MTGSPWLTFFLALIIGQVVAGVISRVLRIWSMRKLGYPPVYCDADGDFRKEEEQ